MQKEKEKVLQEISRKIEAGLESARRGELLDGETVMGELRKHSARRRAKADTKKR